MAGHTGIRTFELVQYISAPIECETLTDLPAQMQDAVLAALEAKSKEVELPLAIVAIVCDVDYGDTPEDDKPYLRIVASEVVMADERTVRALVEKDRQRGLIH